MNETQLKPPTGGPTKDEVLAISFQKIALKQGDIFADIGCGTGRVSIEAAMLAAHVHAIDIRESACEYVKHEIKKAGISNITVHYGDAAILLKSFEKIDSAFIGGSKNLPEVIKELARMKVRSFVINAVMLSTLNTAITVLEEYDLFKEVIMVQISKSTPIADGIMLKPLDPIYIIQGGVN